MNKNKFFLTLSAVVGFSCALYADLDQERNITIEQQVQQVVITFKNFYQNESLFNSSSKQVDVMTLTKSHYNYFDKTGFKFDITYGLQVALRDPNGFYKEAIVKEGDEKHLTAELRDAKISDTKNEDKYVRYNLITQGEIAKIIVDRKLNMASISHTRKKDDLVIEVHTRDEEKSISEKK